MSNSDEDAAQKQWEARNSDRRDTFEGVLWGVRTGEVRVIEHQEHTRRLVWGAEAQWGTNGVLSEDPVAVRQVHVWPSDVSPPADGAMVLADTQHVTDYGELGTGNGHEHDDADWWSMDTYVPAADGD